MCQGTCDILTTVVLMVAHLYIFPRFSTTLHYLLFQAKFDELRKAYSNSKKWSEEEKHQEYYNAVVAVTSPIISSIYPLYPTKVWDYISPKFIILFWTLTMYDLEVPAHSYQREVSKLRASNDELKNNKDMVRINANILVKFVDSENYCYVTILRRQH